MRTPSAGWRHILAGLTVCGTVTAGLWLSATLTLAPMARAAACAAVPPPNDSVARTVYDEGRALQVSDRVMLAGFEAALVESNMNNLDCGDLDSLGVFQQRASWGTRAQRLDVRWAANAFFTPARQLDAGLDSSVSAGALAQKVQRSAHPGRYDQREAQARQFLDRIARGGGLQVLVANVNRCGALYIKQGFWGTWQEHMGCGQATAVAVSPDGQTIAVVRPDNTLVAKQGLWGQWAAHTSPGQTAVVAAGPGGMLANVSPCGSLTIKTSLWGPWQEHMGCGQARSVSLSPDGQTVAVVRPDSTLVAKQGLWGQWAVHTGIGDSQAATAGPGGMLANVNRCGALYIKQGYWGAWKEHMGCGQAKAVAVSPDGQTIAVVRPDDALVAKQGLWEPWSQHTSTGDTKAVALARA
jgi:uncharacterized cupin superfamily protein